MTAPTGAPPEALVRALVGGPGVVSGVDWLPEVSSTNTLAAEAARRGMPEVHVVLTDLQTAGRGRLGRAWQAQAGSSLMLSLMTRPAVPPVDQPLLSLLTGVALADAVRGQCRGVDVALKWPNDLLVDGRKAAGILVEGSEGAVIVGCGVNVDWRGLYRPPELASVTSLSEAAGTTVDRWELLSGFLRVFGSRYEDWCRRPRRFLDDYRRLCMTIGQTVRVTRPALAPLVGKATGVDGTGALLLQTGDGPERIAAGDVEHVRPA